jgi:uncharacterized circularly permuted ATP-grasp superfamily protein
MQTKIMPAVEHYHNLIARDLGAADEQLAMLYQLQQEHRTTFGGRPLSHSLRPAFLSEEQYTRMQDVVYLIRQAILQIAGTFFNDRANLLDLQLTEWEMEMASIPTNVIRFSATARLDAFMTANSFKFVEVNGESPAGAAYSHHLANIYRQLPVFREFEKSFPVRFVSPLEHLVDGLVRIYHEEFDGLEERPSFAIVDFLDVPTYNEFVLIKEYLERFGYPCEIIDPRNLECKDGWIYANGRKIDILYRRLLMNEFHDIIDECGAYLDGYKAQKTCYLNSFRSKLVHKKSIFAYLTDSRYTRILNTLQLQAIREHIPWTRVMRAQQTNYQGKVVDLVDFVRTNRQMFVLKPNDEYGGKGVVLGFESSESEWDDGVAMALHHGYVVQEVVDIHREPFMMKTADGWAEVPTVLDLDPYINGPLMGGCLTRTSTSNLANVTAGGGTLPTFILRYIR